MDNCCVVKVVADASAGHPIGLPGEPAWIKRMVPPYLGVAVAEADGAVEVGAVVVVAGLDVAGAEVTGALVAG